MTKYALGTLINSYYYLPKHILVNYAYSCALEAKHLMDKESIECLEVVEKWLRGEATAEECTKAGDRAYYSAYTAAYCYAYNAAANVAYAAYTAYTAYTTYTAYTAYTTYTATNAAIHASQALDKPISYYYDKFTKHINNLTSLEKMLYLNKT